MIKRGIAGDPTFPRRAAIHRFNNPVLARPFAGERYLQL
jgi:hypothetical protein